MLDMHECLNSWEVGSVRRSITFYFPDNQEHYASRDVDSVPISQYRVQDHVFVVIQISFLRVVPLRVECRTHSHGYRVVVRSSRHSRVVLLRCRRFH